MNPTSKTQLGKTKLQVTALGLGGAAIGGLFHDSTEGVASRTVERAIALGVNLFDTAPLYGAGKSESRLGRALAGVKRDRYVLATKVGYALVPEAQGSNDVYFPFENPPALRPLVDLSYDAVMRSFEESLKRLATDRIDILHIHDPDQHFETAMKGAYTALDKLRRECAISAVSLGTNVAETVIRFVNAGQFDCCLLAGRYTLIDHAALREALPLCERQHVSIIIGGPYNSGILATGPVRGATFNYVPADATVLEKVRKIEKVCLDYSVPLKAAALQFPLAHPAVASVIPGGRSEEEVSENFQLLSFEVPNDFWYELRRQNLLPEEAPVPVWNDGR
jgi:D-threo-aldose 1-dehydrogenase